MSGVIRQLASCDFHPSRFIESLVKLPSRVNFVKFDDPALLRTIGGTASFALVRFFCHNRPSRMNAFGPPIEMVQVTHGIDLVHQQFAFLSRMWSFYQISFHFMSG